MLQRGQDANEDDIEHCMRMVEGDDFLDMRMVEGDDFPDTQSEKDEKEWVKQEQQKQQEQQKAGAKAEAKAWLAAMGQVLPRIRALRGARERGLRDDETRYREEQEEVRKMWDDEKRYRAQQEEVRKMYERTQRRGGHSVEKFRSKGVGT